MSQINSTHNDPAPRSGRRALIAVLTVAIVAAAAGAGYLWWAGNRQLDAIAAEQARQDSIAKWEFFTAEEILSLVDRNRELSIDEVRTFLQRHHLTVLKEDTLCDDNGSEFLRVFIAGKGSELTNIRPFYLLRDEKIPAIKSTSDAPFAITIWMDKLENGKYELSSAEGVFELFFPNEKLKDQMQARLKSINKTGSAVNWEFYSGFSDGISWIECVVTPC